MSNLTIPSLTSVYTYPQIIKKKKKPPRTIVQSHFKKYPFNAEMHEFGAKEGRTELSLDIVLFDVLLQ